MYRRINRRSKKYCKKAGKSNELAFELWNTGYHEAKLLAVLVFDKDITHSDIEKLMDEVVSWDLCDHLCKNLIAKMKDYEEFIYKWITSAHIYKKRAAYTLIATSAIHDKKLSNDTLDKYLKLIRETQDIEHEHIKKAVAWALKEIGKYFWFGIICVLLESTLGIYVVWRIYKNILLRHS